MTLEEYIENRGGFNWRVLREVYSEVARGSIRLVDPEPPASLVEYFFRLDYTLWYWATLTITLLTILVVLLSENLGFSQLLPLRYILGSLYVLFTPGYTLVEVLYPEEKSLTPLERTALSIGLSLSIVPLLGLLLNYTPVGIRLNSVLLALGSFTLLVATAAVYRKYSILRTRKLAEAV